ncbi:hypothetical protein VTI28DRAFT_5684 [Corynascus sepedonium]
MTSFSAGQLGVSANKITKARGKVVKPILKKLAHSEKNSLDLDRGWDEQQVEQLEPSSWDGGGYGYAGQARDVSFGFASAPGLGAGGGDAAAGIGGGGAIRANLKYQHGRSGSQTSGGSGPRATFVHPFAQTPRTSTPPLSYANSLASFDNGRECSPTITENEDDDGFDTSTATLSHSHPHSLMHAHAHASQPPAAVGTSQSNLRRPSLSSQRTASFPETSPSNPPSLRINTGGRSFSGTTATSSRLVHGSFPSPSHSDVHIDSHNLSVSLSGTLDSPTGSLGGGSAINSPQQTSSQLSPLRTSLDMAGFPRLRSHSEIDTATRIENIRAARRKFEEREREKEEKYDREMIRKRERRDNKEASRIEKGEAPSRPSMHRKKTPTGLSTVSEPPARLSGVFDRPAKFSTPVSSSSGIALGIGKRRHTDIPSTTPAKSEKQMGFAARRYESSSLVPQTPPSFGSSVDDVHFDQAPPRRGSGAKRKTQGYWQGFLLWLRTKLLRMSAR